MGRWLLQEGCRLCEHSNLHLCRWMSNHRHWQCCRHHILLRSQLLHHHTRLNRMQIWTTHQENWNLTTQNRTLDGQIPSEVQPGHARRTEHTAATAFISPTINFIITIRGIVCHVHSITTSQLWHELCLCIKTFILAIC